MYFNIKTLRLVYYAIFVSNLCDASLVWAQNTNSVKRIRLLQKNPSECSFKAEIPIQVLYLKCPKFFSPLIRQPLKSAFLLANLRLANQKEALQIKDGQMLVILKYPLSVLKPILDFNICKFSICLESLTKLPSKCYISSVKSK